MGCDGKRLTSAGCLMDRVRTFCRTMWAVWAVGFVLSSGTTSATPAETKNESQAVSELKPLEAGVTLPVQVGRTLRAGKVKPGTVFEMKTTQRVPVSADAYLKHGARVRGEVVTSDAGDGTAAHPSRLTIRFTQLSYQGGTVPLQVRAVAMANLMAVNDTFLSMQEAPIVEIPVRQVGRRGRSEGMRWRGRDGSERLSGLGRERWGARTTSAFTVCR